MALFAQRDPESEQDEPPPRPGRFWRRLFGLLVFLLVGLGLVGGLYALYLDQVVRDKFEGKRWALPARVYAQPLELFAGRALTGDQLAEELDRLGYTKVRQPERSGSYSRDKDRFQVRTRPFQFWDGAEPTRFLEIQINGGQIERVRSADGGGDIPLARLDPALIASIYPTHHEDRVLLKREELPEGLIKTLLAVEDRNYYEHHGVSPLAILRAILRNVQAGRTVQGGSTLTQQLVKNFYLSSKRSLGRKANEAIMAFLLDLRYSKDEILEAYVNEIYMGQDGDRAIHGLGLASHFFFNRRVEDLDLPRIALLVGMIKGPSYYDPRSHPQRAKERRDLVLDLLLEQNLITPEMVTQAKQAGLGVSEKGGRPAGRYPAFLELVRRQMQRDYREEDLRSAGLSIFTTLNPLVQAQTEQALATRLANLEKTTKARELEGAAVVVGVENGEALALAGGRQAGFAGYNRALDARRSIGSLIKPVIYLEALSYSSRYHLASMLQDEPIEVRVKGAAPWRPDNYDGKSHGTVPLYLALAKSYNLATVRLGMDLGLDRISRRLRELGVDQPIPEVPSLLLGSLSLSPLEVAQVYQTMAGGGFRTPLRAVREVLDADGRTLNRYPLRVQQAADPQAVHLLGWAMRQVVEQGTARDLVKRLPAGFKVAGKTGTTNDYRDSWFAGFTGDKLAVVWIGRDDNEPMGLTGANGAMRVWGDIIAASPGKSLELVPPEGVKNLAIDKHTGQLAGSCSDALQLPFIRGSGPQETAPCGGDSDYLDDYRRLGL